MHPGTEGTRRRSLPWRRLAIGGCLLGGIVWTQVARAQNVEASIPITPRAAAEACFKRGLSLANAGQDWDHALREFLESRRLFPTQSATRNAAIASRHLGRFVEATALYDALLSEFAGSLSAAEIRAFTGERAALSTHIGELEIDVSESNAKIVIDGVQRGETPLAGTIQLDEGRHTLRLSKDGFVPIELELRILGGQHRLLQSTLNRATETGTLIVREASGQKLDVLVDSAKVGETPWQGEITSGAHLVLLLGPHHLGTPPSSAEIRTGQITSLDLRAVELSSTLRVEPTPANSTVLVDDVSVGNGAWIGRLPAGPHRIDAIAAGHLPFHQEVWLPPNQTSNVRARLERDVGNPLWRTLRQIPLVFELNGGALLSPTLSGGADDACGCRDRARPHGFIAGLRIGYLLTPRLALELGASYLSLSESMTRDILGQGERNSPIFSASDYRDSTRLRGPLGLLSVSYRMLEKTPLTARLGAGIARLNSSTKNSGTFSGEITNATSGERQDLTLPLNIAEAARVLYVPFASTELRVGYRFSRVFSVDIGAALSVFFPPRVARGGTDTTGSADVRGTLLHTPATWADGKPVVPGRLTLPRETVAGPFLTLAPTVAVQARF